MNNPTIIAIVSLIISVTALIYSISSNRDRFIISSAERKNILEWYERVNIILIKLKENTRTSDTSDKRALLMNLSNLIEIGRFYFPNIDKKDSFGADKPLAYQGYRSIVLEFLVFVYDISKRADSNNYEKYINVLQREFTSSIFSLLNPKSHMQKLSKNSYISTENKTILNDFIKANPNSFNFSSFY